MGDGMSLNNFSWMGYNPEMLRTVGSNNWQWNMFGTYPNDSLAANNDYNQFKFDYNTSIFLDDTARMSSIMGPMVKMLQASIAEWSHKSLMNISGDYPDLTIRDRRTKSDKTDGTDGKSDKIDGTRVIKETDINNTLNAMGVKDSRMSSKEITYTDKDGKEQKTKLLQRLIQLSKDYQDNPENPEKVEISDANYKLLWDIAGKYAKTGDLSREDYATLIEIATNPGGPGAYKAAKEGEEGEEGEKDKKGVRPEKYKAVLENTEAMDYYKKLSAQYKDLLYDSDATEESLAELTKDTTKYNVLEVYKDFNKNYGSIEDENLIDAIFDDTTRWGKVKNIYGSLIDNNLSDDAKPSVTSLSDALIARTKDVIKNNPKLAKEDIDTLKAKAAALQDAVNGADTTIWGWSFKNITTDSKKAISSSFKALADAIDEVETSVYGEFE